MLWRLHSVMVKMSLEIRENFTCGNGNWFTFLKSFMERIFLFVAPWLGIFQSQYDKQVPEKPSLEPPNVTANTADWGASSLPFCLIHSCLLSSKESLWSLPYSGHSGATEGGYPNLWAGIEVINKKPHEKFNFWFVKCRLLGTEDLRDTWRKGRTVVGQCRIKHVRITCF